MRGPRQALHRGGIPRSEIALLYRSNAQSRVLESALFNAGMPYRVYGGLRFFERAEVKHALAYLRLIENANDDTSFLRVVNFPPRGIGARSLEQVQDAARATGQCLHDAVRGVGGKAGANMGAFVASLHTLRTQSQGLSLREIIELVLDVSGLVEHYRGEREGADRITGKGGIPAFFHSSPLSNTANIGMLDDRESGIGELTDQL